MYINKRITKEIFNNPSIIPAYLRLTCKFRTLSSYVNVMIRKRILLSIFVLLAFQLCFAVSSDAGNPVDIDSIMKEQIQASHVEDIGRQLEKYSSDSFDEIFPEYDPYKIIEDSAQGKFRFNFPGLLNGIVKYLLKEVFFNVRILIKLVVLVVLCSILKNLQTSFLSESVGELAFYACYMVIVSVLILSFNTALDLARDIIDSMIGFMHATIPVLITLLVSGGNLASGGVFQPILISVVEVAGTIMKNILLPIIFMSAVLSIIDNISDKIQISKLTSFLRQMSGWILGFILTVFVGIVSIQGSLGAVVDGVASKTAKFTINAMIPVAGKYLADASEAVLGCTLLIKNAAGVAVMMGVIAICVVPLLKIFALLVLYRMTCIIIEPISEKRITDCINDMANSLTFIVGIVASVVFMFLIAITAIISAGNISAMVR